MTKSVRLLAATRKRDNKDLSYLIVTIWPLTIVFTVAPTCLDYEPLFFLWESQKLVAFFQSYVWSQVYPMRSFQNYLNPQYQDIINQIMHITLQKRIVLFSDNGDNLHLSRVDFLVWLCDEQSFTLWFEFQHIL